MKLYPTYEKAQRRVGNLKQQGIWPGILSHPLGMWSLTFDPGDPEPVEVTR